jgi:PAS domain S-box-containing protein
VSRTSASSDAGALRVNETTYGSLYEESPLAIEIFDTHGKLVSANPACLRLFGVRDEGELQGLDLFEDPDVTDEQKELLRSGQAVHCEHWYDFDTVSALDLHQTTRGGRIALERHITPLPAPTGGYMAQLLDVTARRRAELLLRVPSEILAILAESRPVPETARRIVDAVKRTCGFSAVGIRLKEGDDYPFLAAFGYEEQFVDAENNLTSAAEDGLLCRAEDGSVALDCTCGLVIRGPRFPDDPLFTTGGSVWTNDSPAIMEVLAKDDPRRAPRDRCTHVGYRSIALVPVRAGDQTLGLLHLADNGYDRFSDEYVTFFEGLGTSIGLALRRREAEEDLLRSADELRWQLSDTIKAIGAIAGMRDPYTSSHERRVTALAAAIADELGLDGERRDAIVFAGEVHDIGKVGVPAEILTKPSALSEVEFLLIRQHPEAGRDILGPIDFRRPVADIVAQHHERLDGSGYPDALVAEQIMLEARVLAVADVVEAMASHRPYRPGLGIEAALAEVRAGAGARYDADVVAACDRVFSAGFAFPDD